LESILTLASILRVSTGWRAASLGVVPQRVKRKHPTRILSGNAPSEKRRLARATAALVMWARKPDLFHNLSPDLIAAVMQESPAWVQYSEQEIEVHNENAIVDYIHNLQDALDIPELLAVAAADMCPEQREFFVRQCCGETVIENDCYMHYAGAEKLGRILGVVPLMTFSDFCSGLRAVQELQALEGRIAAPDCNIALALIEGWAKTPMASPRFWPVAPLRRAFRRATTPAYTGESAFGRVLAQINAVLPLVVNADHLAADPNQETYLQVKHSTSASLQAVKLIIARAVFYLQREVGAITVPEATAEQTAEARDLLQARIDCLRDASTASIELFTNYSAEFEALPETAGGGVDE